MVHKPKHKVHSFRGLLGSGGQDEISLERSNANLAYRIIKFQIIPNTPGTGSDSELVTKIYKVSQSSVTNTVDFSESALLAVAYYQDNTGGGGMVDKIIFDNTLFSRNIFVTFAVVGGSQSSNYYIEIEEVPVNASALMQLKLGTARTQISGSMGKS